MRKIIFCLLIISLLCGCHKEEEPVSNSCKLKNVMAGETKTITYTSIEDKIKTIEIVTVIDSSSKEHQGLETELMILYDTSPYFGQNAKGIEYEISSVDEVITKILKVNLDEIVIEKLKGLSIFDEDLIHGDESEFYVLASEYEKTTECK